MVKEGCRKLCERNFCLSFERCLLKLIVRFLYIKGVVVGMSLKILIQLCYFLRYITNQHLYVKSWKFNLISLMYVFEKVCSRHPNYTEKINFHLFHLPYDLIFFHLSGSTSTITHTKYYTSQNVFLMMSTVAFFTPCAFCHCCFFSVYNSAYTERAALETTLWYRISQWFDCKSSVVTRKIYIRKEQSERK